MKAPQKSCRCQLNKALLSAIMTNEKVAQPAKVKATFSNETNRRGQSIISDEKKQGMIDMTPSQEKFLQQRQAFAELMKHYPFTTETLAGEEWRDIEGYDGYQVSSFGRVKSLKNCRGCKSRILRPKINSNNYLIVTLWENSKVHFYTVHRLVAKAFIPNPFNKPEVNHIDGCKINACASNLEWTTRSENQQHAFDTGLQEAQIGENSPRAKFTDEQVTFIRNNPQMLNTRELAQMFNTTDTTISRIQLGQNYKTTRGAIRIAKERKTPLSKEIRAQIRAEYVKGARECSANALAKKYGTNPRTVTRIIEGKFEKTPKAPRVSDEIRDKIRQEYKPYDRERSAPALAKKYGISSCTVKRILYEQ